MGEYELSFSFASLGIMSHERYEKINGKDNERTSKISFIESKKFIRALFQVILAGVHLSIGNFLKVGRFRLQLKTDTNTTD